MNILDLLTTLGRWGQEHPQTVLLGCGVVPLAAGLTGLVRRYRQEASDVLGSARWATPREIRDAKLMALHGVVVGRGERQVLCDDSERHILLCAPTGAGKGRGVIIPTLLTWGESVKRGFLQCQSREIGIADTRSICAVARHGRHVPSPVATLHRDQGENRPSRCGIVGRRVFLRNQEACPMAQPTEKRSSDGCPPAYTDQRRDRGLQG